MKLPLKALFYVFSLLWMIAGLTALQLSGTTTDSDGSAGIQSAALLQDRQNIQSSDPAGRSQNSTLTAPVRAILSPVFHFSNKALPFGSDGAFLVVSLFTLLAGFALAHFVPLPHHPALKPDNSALRARAPPALTLA